MNRARIVWSILLTLVCGGTATLAQRAPPRLIIIAPPPTANEPVAKLPPPIAPGMDTNATPSAIVRREAPEGVLIESSKSAPSTKQLESTNTIQKARIEAERARINQNALAWQLDRAAQGSEVAMRSIGFRYLKGDGLPKDEATAREWLKLAAGLGDSAARKELEKLGEPKQSPEKKQ